MRRILALRNDPNLKWPMTEQQAFKLRGVGSATARVMRSLGMITVDAIRMQRDEDLMKKYMAALKPPNDPDQRPGEQPKS
jgi:hypothetical protein